MLGTVTVLKNMVKYLWLIASATVLVTVMIAGFKLACSNYNIISEGWILAVSVAVLFFCAIYNISQHRE